MMEPIENFEDYLIEKDDFFQFSSKKIAAVQLLIKSNFEKGMDLQDVENFIGKQVTMISDEQLNR